MPGGARLPLGYQREPGGGQKLLLEGAKWPVSRSQGGGPGRVPGRSLLASLASLAPPELRKLFLWYFRPLAKTTASRNQEEAQGAQEEPGGALLWGLPELLLRSQEEPVRSQGGVNQEEPGGARRRPRKEKSEI